MLILAPEHVEPMPNAKLLTTTQSAPVPKASVEIHSSVVTKSQMSSHLQKDLIFPAFHLLVDQMLNAEKSMAMSPALVFQATLVLHQTVDLNVY